MYIILHILYSLSVYIYIHIYIYNIEYGHEAKPSILGLQIVFLAARKDYGGDDYCARQEL